MEVRLASAHKLGVRSYLSLFREYFYHYLIMRVSHRGDFLIGLATSFAATISSLGFVLVLFRRIRSWLAGATRKFSFCTVSR